MQPQNPAPYPPAGSPPPMLAQAQSNGAATTAMVLGIIGVILCWIPVLGGVSIILGGIGAVFGHRGFAQARRSPAQMGRGQAIAGLILSYLALAVSLAITIFVGVNIVQLVQSCQMTPANCG
ncbi:MAG: DUF4190 domain-containing protein [Ktedonobacterales bacterium]|nr:DUF4190 domain-containing protein [Ktedonobacterales bacterium]